MLHKMTVPSHLLWQKVLKGMPDFTVVNLADYIKRCGKDRALNRGYKFFMENYLHDVWVAGNDDAFFIKARCYPSQKKSENPHRLWTSISNTTADILSAYCSCKAW